MAQQISTNTFGCAKWIVSSDATQGTHTTIAGALTSASSGDTIFIRPGTYTENLTLKVGVNLAAFDCDALTPNVTISGKATLTAAGSVSISGIRLQTNSDFFLAVTGSAASVVNLKNCFLNCLNNTGISFTSSSSSSLIKIIDCYGDISTTSISLYSTSSSGGFSLINVQITNSGSSSTASTSSSGSLGFYRSNLSFPISTSSTAIFVAYECQFFTDATNTTCVTLSGTGNGQITGSSLFSGSSVAISIGSGTTLGCFNSRIECTNTNGISGSGTLNLSGVVFSGSGRGISVTTKNVTGFNLIGTWTPTVVGGTSAGTATYSSQVGRYYQIGAMVFISFQLIWTSGTGTGNLLIGGLPVNIISTSGARTVGTVQLGVSPPALSSDIQIVAAGDANQTQLFVQATSSTGVVNSVVYAAAGSATGSMWYYQF